MLKARETDSPNEEKVNLPYLKVGDVWLKS